MKAIILAGGFGTRLRTVVNEVPKPMAPIEGKPFLDYLLKVLLINGIDEVILSVCYLKEKIIKRYGSSWLGLKIYYSLEDTPLGTGGAIKKSLTNVKDHEDVIVLNGDSYVDVNLPFFLNFHRQKNSNISIVGYEMCNFERYGAIKISKDCRVVSFDEKKFCKKGFINAGVYCLNKSIFSDVIEKSFSFETFLENNICKKRIFLYTGTTKFIDIGVPEDYYGAAKILPIEK